jgi:murein L,D-transpeptidase YcbB/YkuD
MRIKAGLILVVVAGLLAGGAKAQESNSRQVCDLACELLRNRIEAVGMGSGLVVGSEAIYASEILPSFYEQRAYRLAWSGNGGPLPQARELITVISEAGREGLRPSDYHLERIRAALAALPGRARNARPIDPRLLVDLDLLLTDAFLSYGFHLLNGRLDSESIDPEWHVKRSEVDLRAVLEDALSRNRVGGSIADLLPKARCYTSLREALALYRDISAAGGWEAVPEGPKMELGSSGERVSLLRRRLAATRDLDSGKYDGDVFDQALEEAVKGFQRRHGLETDGIVGPKTLAALNVSVEQRVRQMEVNMERWRWLPKDLGDRYIQVNIAAFDLYVFEAGRRIMSMRAITGRDYRRTPVFSDLMTYLVICPFWNVPPTLAVQDKLPLIKKTPGYLAEQKIKVLSGWGAETVEIDPATVDWSKVDAQNFKWRLRQDPGPLNALGRLKFMFPNKFNVYLHDTPSRELFDLPVRAFSSGCIRIEQPVELAEYLLRGYPEWTRPAILAAIEKGQEQTVRLPEPITVHLLYCTAFVEEDGVISFRNDIYGRDTAVADALRELPPTAADVLLMGHSETEESDG